MKCGMSAHTTRMKGRPRAILAAKVCAAVLCLTTVLRGSAPAADIADVTPADTLLYVEITRPAELWASLQNTELRQAVKASFAAELVLCFFSATADVLCQSLTDRGLGQAAEQYDPTIGLVFCPPDPADPSDDPEIVTVLRAAANSKELQTLLADRVEKTLTARFPRVKITTDRIGDHLVKHVAFSPKRVWTLAFPGDAIIYGRRRAVRWMLTSEAYLGNSAKYAQARKNISLPAGAHVFCYSETTQPAGMGALTCKAGTVMSGVLEIDVPAAGPALVRDRILLSGNIVTPRPGPARACLIGSVFPAGPWLANQISFASPTEAARYLKIPKGPNEPLGGALATTGFVALTTGSDGLLNFIFAAEVARPARLEAALESIGFKKQGNAWQNDTDSAVLKNGCLYIGRSAVMEPLLERLTAAEPKMISDQAGFRKLLAMLPAKSHGYSVMTAEFLLGPGCLKVFEPFRDVLMTLSPSIASATQTDKGIEITSVSPCGYGIWLVSANLAATTDK